MSVWKKGKAQESCFRVNRGFESSQPHNKHRKLSQLSKHRPESTAAQWTGGVESGRGEKSWRNKQSESWSLDHETDWSLIKLTPAPGREQVEWLVELDEFEWLLGCWSGSKLQGLAADAMTCDVRTQHQRSPTVAWNQGRELGTGRALLQQHRSS